MQSFGLSTGSCLSSQDKGSHFLCCTILSKNFINIELQSCRAVCQLFPYPKQESHFKCCTFLSKITIIIKLWRFGLYTGSCLSSQNKGSHFLCLTFFSKISIDVQLKWFRLWTGTGPCLFSRQRFTLLMSHFFV